jgi:hypothetical protein
MLFYLSCTAKLNYMDAVKLDFIQHQFTKLVNNLAFFNVSAGKIHFDIVTPLEHIPKYKEFLLSDKEFRENTKAPASVLGEAPLPLRSNNMQEAIAGLQKSIDAFVESFTTVANKTTVHPVFGVLNFEEWVLLHYKHVVHHGRQFGVV